MKKAGIILLAFASLIISSCGVLASSDAVADAAAAQLVADALATGNLRIEVETIIPSRGPSRTSFDGYYLSVKDGLAKSYLPFFGVSHASTIYGVDTIGIEFEDCPVEVRTDRSKASKGKYIWDFVAVSGKEKVAVSVTFFDNGTASISCNPEDRSPMSYNGRLVEFPRDK